MMTMVDGLVVNVSLPGGFGGSTGSAGGGGGGDAVAPACEIVTDVVGLPGNDELKLTVPLRAAPSFLFTRTLNKG